MTDSHQQQIDNLNTLTDNVLRDLDSGHLSPQQAWSALAPDIREALKGDGSQWGG